MPHRRSLGYREKKLEAVWIFFKSKMNLKFEPIRLERPRVRLKTYESNLWLIYKNLRNLSFEVSALVVQTVTWKPNKMLKLTVLYSK